MRRTPAKLCNVATKAEEGDAGVRVKALLRNEIVTSCGRFSKALSFKNVPSPLEIRTFKGHSEVHMNKASGIRDLRLKFCESRSREVTAAAGHMAPLH